MEVSKTQNYHQHCHNKQEDISSRPEVFYKKVVLKNFKKFLGIHLCRKLFLNKGVLKNFAIFTEIHLCQSLFSNKATGWIPATLFKKRLWHSCFHVRFRKFVRTPFI